MIAVCSVFGLVFSGLYHIVGNHLQWAMLSLDEMKSDGTNKAGMMIVILGYLCWCQPFMVVGSPFLFIGLLVYMCTHPEILYDVIGSTGDGIFGILALMNFMSK